MEYGDSQQGNSSEGAPFSVVPSTRALSHIGTGPSGHQVKEGEVDFECGDQSLRDSRKNRLGHALLVCNIRADAQRWDEVPDPAVDEGRLRSL